MISFSSGFRNPNGIQLAKVAIDAFLTCYAESYQVIQANHQMVLQKLAD